MPAPRDWRPTATHTALAVRAAILGRIRRFFADRGVLEVETPLLSRAATSDPRIESFTTRYTGPGAPDGLTLYLHTSPEFAMKRLLAAGSGSIYQICRVFRSGEAGRLHNPEFTMLEWYRLGFDHHRLMDETADLVTQVLQPHLPLGPREKLAYAEAFRRHCGIDPHAATPSDLRAAAAARGITAPPGLDDTDLDGWRDLLLTHLVEPALGRGRLTLLHDYPASQAALARIRPGTPPLAERFEVYLNGVELANGFHELSDSNEQRGRFERDLAARAAQGLPVVPYDECLLDAMTAGLPDCAGVALGVDRLVMLAAGAAGLDEVIAFPLDRA